MSIKKNDKLVISIGIIILLVASVGIYLWSPPVNIFTEKPDIEDIVNISGVFSNLPESIIVSDRSPFFALMATPIAIHYDNEEQKVIPLYVENIDNPSNAVIRAKDMIGIPIDITIGGSYDDSVKNTSLELANKYWESSEGALIIENNQMGYNIGLSAVPISSYLNMPVIITDNIDEIVIDTLENLGVKYTFICGENITNYGKTLRFDNINDILNTSIYIVTEKFGSINYITLTNPLDTTEAEVLEKTVYSFEGTVASSTFTPTHAVNMATGFITGTPMIVRHEFEVPNGYKYARIRIHAEDLIDENVDDTGSQLQPMLYDPDGNWLALAFTVGGIPERDSNGDITKDQVDWYTIVYNQPGTYPLNVAGQYLTQKNGDYKIDVTVENLNTAITPNMKCLSSISPYLTAYHKGIIFSDPEFVFVGDESILSNPPIGVAFPASNPDLIEYVNEHTFEIHNRLNEILAELQQIELNGDDDLEILKQYYDENPIYIAIVGDARMVPQYYYYDTEDANSLQYGWDVASDFIYGNIDPIPRDDKLSIYPKDQFLSDFDEKYPHQENIVGRITGWDVQDASALIVRTIFYDNIIEDLGEWKNTAVVQTGSGTDFQRVPFVDLFRKIIGAHDLPFKWPTGEAHFENMIIQNSLESGDFEIRSTENTESMRKGLSDEVLTSINRLGPLNLLLFPKIRVKLVAGEKVASGGVDQTESNFIFTFGHGQPMGYSHGDVQTGSMGFRPVIIHNLINRFMFGTFMPQLNSAIGNVGGYNVRAVSNMELGPSVVFVESCYIGRIDGFPANCTTSQAYIHAGVNTFIASSRGTPGPGYLDARRSAKGFGISEWIKTTINPSLQKPHFSALHAVNIFNDLINKDVDVGTAFRNAKNKFMEDANSTFFWTPPLCINIQTSQDLDFYFNNIRQTSSGTLCMEKKYTCLFEYNLFGDPAFNPYEPNNRG